MNIAMLFIVLIFAPIAGLFFLHCGFSTTHKYLLLVPLGLFFLQYCYLHRHMFSLKMTTDLVFLQKNKLRIVTQSMKHGRST